MPAPPNETPLGMFYGDSGGPAATPPTSSTSKNCPFLDPEENAFCTLDGALCPFVGFSYSKCKKYINNLSKGLSGQNMANFAPAGKPPRLESLTEAKKKVSNDVDAANNAFAATLVDKANAGVADMFGFTGGDIPSAEAPPPPKPPNPPKRKNIGDKTSAKFRTSPPTPKTAPSPPPEASAPPPAPKKGQVVGKTKRKKADKKDIALSNASPSAIELMSEFVRRAALAKKSRKQQEQFFADPENVAIFAQAAQSTLKIAQKEKETDLANQQRSRETATKIVGAFLIKDANMDRYTAYTAAEDIVNQVFIRAGEDLEFNPKERERQKQNREKAADAAAKLFVNNIHPDKPTGKGTAGVAGVTDVATEKKVAAPTGSFADAWKNYKYKVGDEPDHEAPKAKAAPKSKTKSFADAWKKYKYKVGDEPEHEAPTPDAPAAPVHRTPTGPGAQQSTSYMNEAQFREFAEMLRSLPKEDQEAIFSGWVHEGKPVNGAIDALEQQASKYAKQKAYKSVADLYSTFYSRLKGVDKLKANKILFQKEWDQNLERLEKLPLGDRNALSMYKRLSGTDTEAARASLAGKVNKVMDRLYDLEMKTIKVGDHDVQTFSRKLAVPTFNKTDYEMMRASEQLGLYAIHKTHQYGRQYGKWNTWNLFARSVIVPLVLAFTPFRDLIRPIMQMWPQALFDQFYHSYIAKPLPKLKAGGEADNRSVMRLSRDDKFLASQKMANPTTQERLMKGWDKDMVLPPNEAILHKRWYPTTKQSWGKTRHGVLLDRYEKTKGNLLPKATKRSFLRK